MSFIFVVYRYLGVSSALELSGATVALSTGTEQEILVSDFFRENGMIYEPVPVETLAEMEQQFQAGAADVGVFPEDFAIANGYADPPYTILTDFRSDGPPVQEVTRGDDVLDRATATDDLEINALRGDDRVTTGAGDDTVKGAGGMDRLWLGAGDDLGIGGAGADRLYGQAGRDVLRGNGGADSLEGGGAGDLLVGGGGADTLIGGAGNDTLSGGNGRDVFVFNRMEATRQGIDTVRDFDAGKDTLAFVGVEHASLEVTAGRGQTRIDYDGGAIVLTGETLTENDLALIFL